MEQNTYHSPSVELIRLYVEKGFAESSDAGESDAGQYDMFLSELLF